MNQALVREIYLRVIDTTIEGVRTEFQDKGASDAALDSLNRLKDRWTTRLTHLHDFTDDPTIIDKPPASAKTGKKVPKGSKKKGSGPSATTTPSRNGAISVAALTNNTVEYAGPPLPPVPRTAHPGGKRHAVPEVIEVKGEEPPAKRPRTESLADDEEVLKGEDLDSSDSDSEDESEEEQAECFVLAQHERVRKGPKWKVNLREGIVSIRGREYLFNKATCDLDF